MTSPQLPPTVPTAEYDPSPTPPRRPTRRRTGGLLALLGGAVLASSMTSPAVGAAGAHEASASPAATAPAPPTELGGPAALPQLAVGSGIRISELANGGAHSDSDGFFELENAGDQAVDLSGWGVFRCSAQGLRANTSRPETALDGVVLAPGDRYLVAKAGARLAGGAQPDAVFTQPFAASGFGLVVQDGEGRAVDAVGVYPNEPWPLTSECTPPGGNLPNSLAGALGESWQRAGAADWVRAPATPGRENATREADASADGLRVTELAAAGPGGGEDEFVELANLGARPVPLAGWTLRTCDAVGRLGEHRPVFALPDRELAPGDRMLVAGPAVRADGVPVDVRSELRLSAAAAGVVLVDADGHRADGIAVSGYRDSACQTSADKLSPLVDHRTGESWQRRAADGADGPAWIIAERTPGVENASVEHSLRTQDAVVGGSGVAVVGVSDTSTDAAPAARRDVAISEFATDPAAEELDPGMPGHNFVELGNYGDTDVDISGWSLIACGPSGARLTRPLASVPGATTLAPGATWLAAREGSPEAAGANAVYRKGLDFRGSGVWVEDEAGDRVDRVGAYLANEMDASVERPSLCTNGLSLTTFAPDRVRGETYRRAAFTGVDADDFTTAAATPGRIDLVERADPATAALAIAARRAGASSALAAREGTVQAGAEAEAGAEDAAEAPGGTRAASVAAPAATTAGSATLLADAGSAMADGTDWPALTFTVDTASLVERRVSWRGHATARVGVELAVRDPATDSWRTLDSAVALEDATAAPEGAEVVLEGTLRPSEASASTAEVRVSAVPRASTLDATVEGAFADPADYDLALSHLTDTQYLAEAHPEAYAEMVSWVVANRDARKIAFAAHTGDLVQNWVDPDQSEALARREFDVASRMQAVLDDAGVPNSVLPGNHDSKRGMTVELFNEAFPPARYADEAWYGGSIAPGDNSASFSVFEAEGAPFLVLSLPYAYGERELAWAEQVVADHPDRNVVIATHEHVRPKEVDEHARRSVDSRWVSRGGELWERIIAPNANVVLVLSGHFHGVGTIVTEDAGGIPGHTVVETVADYQEFRTHTGERATGFQRLLQLDLAGGAIGVDTFSATLGAHESFPYDYVQFVPETGNPDAPSSMRPWRVVDAGVQGRYTAADDEFLVDGVTWQFTKRLETTALTTG